MNSRPLSFGQEQLWFLEELAPGRPTYNIAVRYRLDGPLDTEALRQAVESVVRSHDVLRARFGLRDGVPFQEFPDGMTVDLAVTDLSGLPEREREAAALDASAAESRIPFDLKAGPPCRFRLFRIAADVHLFSMVVHHIVSDGWSFGLINKEISAAYQRIVAGQPLPEQAPTTTQYADFVAAQRAEAANGGYLRHLDYWKKQLDALPVLELPADRPRPALAGHPGDALIVDLPAELHAAATALARQRGVSLSMLLTSVFGIVLARYTGQEDLPIGTTALGRTDPAFERVIGLFVNMVVLRLDLSDDPTFTGLLERVSGIMLDAYDHQAVPFERVVDHLKVSRDPSRNPLFQVCVQVLESDTTGGALALPGLAVTAIPQLSTQARFDLSLTFAAAPDSLALSIEYSTELFDRWRIDQLARHIERVLATVVAEPGTRLSQIDLLSEADRAALLAAGVGPHDELPTEPVHVTVARQAAQTPDAVAVVFEGAELTYGELDARANTVAGYLRSVGVGHEDIVGVALERGLEVLVAFLGVLKAGGAFVVLDTDHPVNRLEFILDDAGVEVVLTSAELLDRLPAPGRRTYACLDRDWAMVAEAAAGQAVPELATRDSLVYALYTSGSTGNPKGVLIEHRALTSYLKSFVDRFGLGPGDRMLQFASLAFDLSQAEIFSALISGAALVFCRRDTLLSPEALSEVMRRERVTYIGAPPAMLSLLEPEPYPDLRNVLVGGEACPAELVNRWNLPGRQFVNGYGPTEATIGATMFTAPRIEWRSSPPIGGPLQHRRLYVVDKWGALTPTGVPGELLIGGDEGLARGYLNRPDLTSARFIPDPFRPDAMVYRSGDLVRWNTDGQLEFIGRVDTQVKLRGLRIELEEIEAVLVKHPKVGQAAVALREDSTGQKLLAGYITLAGEESPTLSELRAHLAEHVPSYMVPTAWAILNALPLSVAGKVNRLALPEPTLFAEESRQVTSPTTVAERHVVAAIAEVLGIDAERISVDDDFFELGGSSLVAMRLISRLNRAFGASLGIRALYGAAKLVDIAANLERTATREPEALEGAGTAGSGAAAGTGDTLAGQIAGIFAEALAAAGRTAPVGLTDNLDRIGADGRVLAAIRDAVSRRFGVTLTERSFYSPSVLAALVAAERGEAVTVPALANPTAGVATGSAGTVPGPAGSAAGSAVGSAGGAGVARQSRSDSSARAAQLVRLAGGPAERMPLVCVPAVSGSPFAYAGLARGLEGLRPVYGLQAPGLDPGEQPLNSVEALAEHFVRALREQQPRGPYQLLGWSMGGLVAFEMARLLTDAGAAVPVVAVLDTQLPNGGELPGLPDLVGRFVLDLAAATGAPEPALDRLADLGTGTDLLDAAFELLVGEVLPEEVGIDQVRRQWAVFLANSQATYAYRPDWTYPGQLTVIRTADARTPADQWRPLANSVTEHITPGDHNSMWSPANLPTLTRLVINALHG